MHTLEPNPPARPQEATAALPDVSECIDIGVACAMACVACADACLGDAGAAALRRCIHLSLDCADTTTTLSRLLSRFFEPDPSTLRAQLEACARACELCAAECHRYEERDHCRACGDACTRCEQACRRLLSELA